MGYGPWDSLVLPNTPSPGSSWSKRITEWPDEDSVTVLAGANPQICALSQQSIYITVFLIARIQVSENQGVYRDVVSLLVFPKNPISITFASNTYNFDIC